MWNCTGLQSVSIPTEQAIRYLIKFVRQRYLRHKETVREVNRISHDKYALTSNQVSVTADGHQSWEESDRKPYIIDVQSKHLYIAY